MSAINKGNLADILLRSEAFTDALKNVRAAIIEKWEAAPLRDKEGAHELKLMLKLLTDIESNLRTAVENGRFEAEDLKIKRDFKDDLARRLRIA